MLPDGKHCVMSLLSICINEMCEKRRKS